MPPSAALRIDTVQLPHTVGQIGLRRFDEQVILIVQQTGGVAAPGQAVEHVPDHLQEAAG
jgi:hypothetical protein